MKTIERLKKQAKNPDNNISQDGKNCLLIYNKLLELNDGHVWQTDFGTLVKCQWINNGNWFERRYKPSKIGEIFINGLKK